MILESPDKWLQRLLMGNSCTFPSFADEPKGATASKPSTNKKNDSKHRTVYTVASKQMLISLAPPVLTLHLKRFQQARFTLRKLTKHVDFPLELNVAPFCSRSGKVSREDGFDPDIVWRSFILSRYVSLRNTENQLDFPQPRTDYLKRSILYSGAQL